MILKSIITVVISLVIFEVALRVWPVKWDTSQSDKSANIIGAQNFVYNIKKDDFGKDTVIVGSSISRKLVADTLGKNYINLAFNGWSAFDGLDLIKRSKELPGCILIESNSLREVITQEEIENIFSPVSGYKQYVKFSQLNNQPVGLLIGYLKELMKEKILAAKKSKRSNVALYNYAVQMAKKDYRVVMEDSVLNRRLTVIKGLVDYFVEKKVRVILFEVPIDKELMNSNYISSARTNFRRYFPETSYYYIPTPPNTYTYSDGTHLVPESAIDFTKYLRSALDSAK